MFGLLIALWLAEVAALAAAGIQRIRVTVLTPELMPFNYLLGASLFALTSALAVWRLFNPKVLAEEQHWVAFLAGAAGLPLLSIALCVVGRFTA